MVLVSGNDSIALARVAQLIDLIEFLCAKLKGQADQRLIVHIRERTIWIDL